MVATVLTSLFHADPEQGAVGLFDLDCGSLVRRECPLALPEAAEAWRWAPSARVSLLAGMLAPGGERGIPGGRACQAKAARSRRKPSAIWAAHRQARSMRRQVVRAERIVASKSIRSSPPGSGAAPAA